MRVTLPPAEARKTLAELRQLITGVQAATKRGELTPGKSFGLIHDATEVIEELERQGLR